MAPKSDCSVEILDPTRASGFDFFFVMSLEAKGALAAEQSSRK